MKVSIIIPVHNQCILLENCIKSIYEKTKKTEFQIVIINDGSDIETSNFCKKLLQQKKIQKLITNVNAKGFTTSCNQGVIESKNFDLLCFLNSDTIVVTEDWLEKVIKVAYKNEKIACVGVLSNNATSQSVGEPVIDDRNIQSYGDWIVSLSEKKYPTTSFINGFCFFIKTKIQNYVGLMDSNFFPHYGSEDDLMLRVRKKGFELVIADDIYVYHRSNQSYKSIREKIIVHSYPALAKKWGLEKVKKDSIFATSVLDYLRDKIKKNKFVETNEIKKAGINVNAIIPVKLNNDETCDIIIVVHNALTYLQRCVDSIRKYTNNFKYNIIIVDNCSNYETKSYIKSLKNIKVITNTKNYGFGYANNQAIRCSSSKYVCFLNSDTIVTNNWLSNLVVDLENNNAGIVGPVTNNASSDVQQIECLFDYKTESNDDKQIQDFANKIHKEFNNKIQETNRLIGFCMVMKRDILDKSGIFDDRYEFNFEDDDLGLRVIELGYKLYCSLGIFIYHFGSKSFKERFNVETHSNSLEASRELYVEKWYQTERIKSIYENHYKPSIIYILASNSPSGGVKVVFEHANRLKDRGYDVSIYCNKNECNLWFDLYAPINYFSDIKEIPEVDIAIGTYFTTLPILQNINAKVKIHLCQGYEVELYRNKPECKVLIETIKNNYMKIKNKIVVSRWLQETILSEFNLESNYVTNGIDKYVYSFSEHKKNKIPRILIVGNYNLEFKGVKIALEAVNNYIKTNKVIIVRLSSEKTKYEENYEFHDMTKMTQDEIAEVYSSCDVTINAPYKVEGFSLPPLESMANGTPVITTDCGGVNDYALNNKNCLMVAPKNPIAIQHALKILLTNESIYSRLVKNGLDTAKEYIWYNKIDVLEDVLCNLYKKQIDSQKEKLSVCMIVKNEQACLENCLQSIKDLASEINIVDTGSSDETIRIAKQFGAKIYHFEWIDDFSAARNFSLEKATQPWTLVLDADEIISLKDISNIRDLLKGPKIAYAFTTRNYVKDINAEGININSNEYENEEKGYVGWCRSDKVRLFPTNKDIKFSGHVHELLEPSINNLNLEIKFSNVPIHHYSMFSLEKSKQYLELGKQKAIKSCNAKSLFELGTQYMVLNNYDEALVIWRKLLEKDNDNFDVLARLGTTYNFINEFEQAEKFFIRSLQIQENEYAIKHLGICYAKQNKIEKAYDIFKKIIYTTNDLKTMTDFAFCCNSLRKYDESISILEKCLILNKDIVVKSGLLEVAYNEKGIELANRNNFVKAVVMFKSALVLNPNFDIAKNNLSVINKLLQSGQFSKKFIK